ncbi:hypothetical protein M885DRAFT_520421 [Pelagophyceae sp. CCMP2097]|nr:hypothetical protein M885DRAFT_520421 [Pelagophyceae sp. CCMP2097]
MPPVAANHFQGSAAPVGAISMAGSAHMSATAELWKPRECSISGDAGHKWRGPVGGPVGRTRPITPTEAASRRAWGRSDEPFQYLFEVSTSPAFSSMRKRGEPARQLAPPRDILADRARRRDAASTAKLIASFKTPSTAEYGSTAFGLTGTASTSPRSTGRVVQFRR